MKELVQQLTAAYGPSGRETEVADLIEKLLKGKVDSFHRDALGNLICEKKGTDKKGKRIMFSAHMDTVVPGKGVKPRVDPDGFVRTDGTTVLGGDDKAGICAIMEAMKAVRDLDHRTVEAVITVREESGIFAFRQAAVEISIRYGAYGR